MGKIAGTKRPASPKPAISPPPLKRKVESTVTRTTVAAFFTPSSQKKPEKISWRTVDRSLLAGRYAKEHVEKRPAENKEKKWKVAAFDLDGTFISTSSGNRFARDSNDWKWWHQTVPDRIRELDANGYRVVVFSNQKKINLQSELKAGRSESKSLSNFKEKSAAVMRQLDVPMSIYAATQYDEYRKPRMSMWNEFLDDYDLDIDDRIDLQGSFFVGDAAGRPGDHSNVDRGFAANVGIAFKTPEEFFLGAAAEQIVRHFDPASYIDDASSSPGSSPFARRHPLELVIFCGSPGAGKSTFYWKYLKPLGYERANQDILKTRQKCLKTAQEHLAVGVSVAIDNTNADPETRAFWTQLAREMKVPIRCIYFTAAAHLCLHNNAVRAANPSLNPESRTSLPHVAFADYERRFREPQLLEGFEDIVRIDFHFEGDDTAKKAWSQFWA